MIGTVRYASINIHNGIEPSRRDDLISIGYMLIYFIKGKLPWQGLKATTVEDKYEKIGCIKKNISLIDLCNGIPKSLIEYFKYCYGLEFKDKPDYDKLIDLLLKILIDNKYNPKQKIYDWDIEHEEDLVEIF